MRNQYPYWPIGGVLIHTTAWYVQDAACVSAYTMEACTLHLLGWLFCLQGHLQD